jgi:hypothetical protein
VSTIFDRVLTVNLIANTVIFYVAARLYLLPLLPRVRPQQVLVPILLLHSTRHLGLMFLTRGATFCGNAAAICVSRWIWRPGNGHTCVRGNSIRIAQLGFGQACGMDFQYFWNPGSADSDHVCHDLQCTLDDGTGLLDSRFLGSVVVGDTLRDFCSSSSALGALSRRNGFCSAGFGL